MWKLGVFHLRQRTAVDGTSRSQCPAAPCWKLLDKLFGDLTSEILTQYCRQFPYFFPSATGWCFPFLLPSISINNEAGAKGGLESSLKPRVDLPFLSFLGCGSAGGNEPSKALELPLCGCRGSAGGTWQSLENSFLASVCKDD